MPNKIRVGIVFGGQSAEHEISLLSARSVVNALDKQKYDPVLIGIQKSGEWCVYPSMDAALSSPDDPKRIHLNPAKEAVALVTHQDKRALISLSERLQERFIDVLFPVLHGTFGEDGTLQGLLKLANVPFVGAGVLGSAIGMDKDVMKRLLRDAGVPIPKFLSFHKKHLNQIRFENIEKALGLPFFIKPANTGSSVGISKIKAQSEFEEKLHHAFRFDRKVIIEQAIQGREIECSVLGNDDPIVSLPGEIIPQHEFYSYEAKYLDEQGARLELPARVSEQETQAIRTLALQAYQVLCCEGMARVDVFLQPNGEVLLNEINTIPGFTKISMYPKLWELSGLPYPKLIDKLIELAFERFREESLLAVSPMVEEQMLAAIDQQ